jgi:hypothetical protein
MDFAPLARLPSNRAASSRQLPSHHFLPISGGRRAYEIKMKELCECVARKPQGAMAIRTEPAGAGFQ